MLLLDRMVVISVSDCHAVVSRYRRQPDGSLTCECARNAAELETEAIVALTTLSTSILIGTHHPCPAELAARAEWS
jgi:hypothetical protein